MKQTLFIDPRIRDNVFIPLVILMMIVAVLRYYITKLMYQPDSPLLHKASLSHKVLKQTLLERYADLGKEPNQE